MRKRTIGSSVLSQKREVKDSKLDFPNVDFGDQKDFDRELHDELTKKKESEKKDEEAKKQAKGKSKEPEQEEQEDSEEQ